MNKKSIALGCVLWTVLITLAAAVFWDTPPVWSYLLREALPYYGYTEKAREEAGEEPGYEADDEPEKENEKELDGVIVFSLNKTGIMWYTTDERN